MGVIANGCNITFFQTFDRIVWRGTPESNNGWWSFLNHNGYILQTNNRIFKKSFMIENLLSIGLTTICGVLGVYWFIKGQSN